MTDFEPFDAGFGGVAGLQLGDDASAVVAQLAILVEIGVKGGADEAAIALQIRQFICQRLGELIENFARRGVQPVGDLGNFGRRAITGQWVGKQGRRFPRASQPVAQRAEVARTAPIQ